MSTDWPWELNVAWLAFDIAGQLCLLALLITLAVVKHLPQRTNPFLVNFILASFLATIPPALLLYAGQEYSNQQNALCNSQSALVNGVAPMFGVALLALVFDTWCELRSLCLHKSHLSRGAIMKLFLISAPYAALWAWTFASFVAADHTKASPGFVFCITYAPPSDMVRHYVGVFLAVVDIIELILEVWVAWMIYSYPTKVQEDPRAWRTTIQFALRVIIFSFVQFIAVLLGIIDSSTHSQRLKIAYELLNSMNALATFIAFGTQKNILRSWRFWGNRKPDDVLKRPQDHPMLDWTAVPLEEPTQFDGDAFGREGRREA